MGAWAVIEIASIRGKNPPAGLILCAYRASQTGLVALVLNDVDPRTVNRILDPLVRLMPLTIPGVLYLKINDDAQVREAVLSARMVFVATKEFHTSVVGLGIDQSLVWPARSALTLLGPAPPTQADSSLASSLHRRSGGYRNSRPRSVRHPEFQRA
jgi:hypothetical protein